MMKNVNKMVEEKNEYFKNRGIHITDLERVKKDEDMSQKFISCLVYTKTEMEVLCKEAIAEIQRYAFLLGKSVCVSTEIAKQPKGQMTFYQLLEAEEVRIKALRYYIKLHMELMQEYLEKVYTLAIKDAEKAGKRAVHFIFPRGTNEYDDPVLSPELKQLDEIKNGNYSGGNLYQHELGAASQMIILVEKAEEGKNLYMKEGVDKLLSSVNVNDKLTWAFV